MAAENFCLTVTSRTQELGRGRPYHVVMTRDALEKGFETYVTDIISTAYEQFDVTAAFGTGTTSSGRLVSQLVKNNALLDRNVVQPALESYETDVLDQVQVLLDYIDCPRLYRFILKYESSAYLQESARAQTEDLEAPFQAIYQDGVEQGLFRPLPESIYASFFTGPATHLVQEHLNGETALDESRIDQTFEMLWAAYTTKGPSSSGS